MYSFEFDRGTGVLLVTLEGYWTIAIAERFSNELENQVRDAKRTGRSLKLLMDFSKHGTQTSDIAQYMSRKRQEMPKDPSDMVALCLPSAFTRNLAQRQPPAYEMTRVFSSVGAARAWLLDRGGIQASAAA